MMAAMPHREKEILRGAAFLSCGSLSELLHSGSSAYRRDMRWRRDPRDTMIVQAIEFETGCRIRISDAMILQVLGGLVEYKLPQHIKASSIDSIRLVKDHAFSHVFAARCCNTLRAFCEPREL